MEKPREIIVKRTISGRGCSSLSEEVREDLIKDIESLLVQAQAERDAAVADNAAMLEILENLVAICREVKHSCACSPMSAARRLIDGQLHLG